MRSSAQRTSRSFGQTFRQTVLGAIEGGGSRLHTYVLTLIMLSTWLWGCYFPALYVAPLYLWRGLPRSHPTSIRRRMGVSIVTSAAAWVPTWLALSAEERHTLPSLLGLCPGNLSQVAAAVALALALTAVLFAGPLYMLMLDWQAGVPLSGRLPVGLPAWRNLLVAPLTEEFVFRSCLVSFLLARGVSPRACIFLSPLAFGASHVHHLHDLVRHQGYPLQQACLAVLFQMCYTTLFGWYATFLFLRTASLAAVVVVHSFCNFMGFPPLHAIPSYPRPARVMLVYGAGIALFTLLLRHLSRTTPLWAGKEEQGLSHVGSPLWSHW